MKKVKSKKLKGFLVDVSLRLCVSAVIVFVFASVVHAQRETPPAGGGQPKPFVFPRQDNFTLPNGMRVTLVQYGSIPKVAVQAIVRAGSLNEKAEQRWISDTIAALLKEGTTTRSAEDIARQTAEMGGNIFTTAQTDKTIVGGEVLSEFDARFIGLIADLILNPKFAAADLEIVRANKLRELTIARAQPGTIAFEKFREITFPGHAYGSVFPSEVTLKSYTLDQVKAFYNDNYGAARTHLYVVGQFEAARTKSAIEKAFGGMKRGTPAIRNVPKIEAKRSLTLIDQPGATQSNIYLGMPTSSPSDDDYIKLTVMNTLLGGAFGSRITRNLREDKGYTYSPFSTVWNRYKTGYWYETAAVTTQHTGASIKEILGEIERMQKEPPSEEEMQGIRNYLVGIYVLQNSTRAGVLNQLENVNYNELPANHLDTYVQKVVAVTAKDLQDMAKKYLVSDKMTIVVVGDKSQVAAQLAPYEK